jgi:hypothetical protein
MQNETPYATSQMLVASWIIEQMTGGQDEAMHDDFHRRLLSDVTKFDYGPAWREVPAVLKIFVYATAAERGVETPILKEFVYRAAAICADMDHEGTDGEYSEAHMLLRMIGALPDARPPTVDAGAVFRMAERVIEGREVDKLIVILNHANGFGTTTPACQLPPWLREALDGLASHALRQNDLIMATRSLRCRIAFRADDDWQMRANLDELIRLQHPEGYFGLLGAELRGLCNSPTDRAKILLPVCLEALMTIGSAIHGRSLYGAVPRIDGPCSRRSETQPIHS